MFPLELIFIAIALSMDAFAVSISKGLAAKRFSWKYPLIVGVYFGAFQALMPFCGHFLGSYFLIYIREIDHWVAFALLVLIGANAIRESLAPDKETKPEFGPRQMFPLAIATSIDALAVGVSFAVLGTNISVACATIGALTFLISAVGLVIGAKAGLGAKNKRLAERLSGIILIALGCKILLEHLLGL